MKKITVTALILATLLLFSGCTLYGGGADTTTADTIPVTSPEGFEDVTAPPEDTKNEEAKDTSAADDTTAEPETEKDSGKIETPDEAVAAARDYLGETDSDTGYKYAYSYDGMMTEGSDEYFKIRVSWFIEEQERYSLCGYILVSPEGECFKFSW